MNMQLREAPSPVQRRDDMIRILGIPEARQVAPPEEYPDGLPVAWAWVFVWIGVVALAAAGWCLGWLIGQADWGTLLDSLVPTAAQARDKGWVTISEGL